MRVLGVDLAAQPKKTYACMLDDASRKLDARVHGPCDDAQLTKLVKGCAKVGIDAPFGWPDDFVKAVSAHQQREPWPVPPDTAPDAFRRSLSFRLTDRVVTQTRRPLSVSTDKIGVTAMRCAHLLTRWRAANRVGTAKFVEVYPAGALARWGFNARGYKASDPAPLGKLLQGLQQALNGLELDTESEARCASNDDAFDALVASLIARAAAVGLTELPPPRDRARAEREGWIHLPVRGSLPFLGRTRSELKAEVATTLESLGSHADQTSVAHDSAALAKAVFEPFVDRGWPIPVGKRRFAGNAKFEVKRSAGVKGGAPTLDLLVEGDGVLAVESKYTEPFGSHLAKFEDSYSPRILALNPSWRAEYERLIEAPRRYRHLHAAQLVKHYMGLRRSYPDQRCTLAYLYWRPRGAAKLAASAIHAAEIETFAGLVTDPMVEFIAMPYDELWAQWSKRGQPTPLREHAAALRSRYGTA